MSQWSIPLLTRNGMRKRTFGVSRVDISSTQLILFLA